MTNTEMAAPVKPDRKKVSERGFIGPNGGEVDKIEEATGATYALRGGITLTRDFSKATELADRMCAIFGWQTKVGNVANTCLNDKDSPGTVDDAGEAIMAWDAGLNDGTWAERAAGVGMERINKEALATAVVNVKIAAGVWTEEQRGDKYAKLLQMLTEDKTLSRKLRNPDDATGLAVRHEYAKIVGAPSAKQSTDDILAAV